MNCTMTRFWEQRKRICGSSIIMECIWRL
jgi:hypothetical protein